MLIKIAKIKATGNTKNKQGMKAHALLVEMQNGGATLENAGAVS